MRENLTICICAYNEELLIERLLNQIKKQDNSLLKEVIVVDDGSSDKTTNLCTNFAKNYKKLKVITQNNKGAGGARNTCVSNVTSDFFCFLDADDTIATDYVENIINNINTKCDMLFFGYTRYDKKNNSTEFLPKYNEKTNKYSPSGGLCSIAFNLNYFKQHDFIYPENIIYEDNAIGFFIINNSNKIKIINKPLMNYVYNINSITNKHTKKIITDRLLSSIAFIENIKKYNANIKDHEARIAAWYKNAIDACFYNCGSYDLLIYIISNFNQLNPNLYTKLPLKSKVIMRLVKYLGFSGYLMVLLTKLSKKFK